VELRSIAAPVRGTDGQVIAAINSSAQAGRRTLETVADELLAPLLATARRMQVDRPRQHRVRPGPVMAGRAGRQARGRPH
jgi:Bacterial transcriptional regulator